MSNSRPTVLVTGGAGYVGSHTAKVLRESGYTPVIFDDLSTGHREAVGESPLVVGGVRDVEQVRSAIRSCGASAVLHFAALLSVPESIRNPIAYYELNVGGALATLEAMAAEGCRRFIFSSTCAVYGEPQALPIAESVEPVPISSYGETKLAVERALPHFERAYGISFTALRYFNAAGADPDGVLGEDHRPEVHLLPSAIDATRDGRTLEIYAGNPTTDGTCVRDYVHVMDLASAHVLALKRLEAGHASATYNLGSGRPASTFDVFRAVHEVTGRAVSWRSIGRREGDPLALYASSDKAERELGWRAQRSQLQTIVQDTWRWRQSHPVGYQSLTSSIS